MSPSDVRERAGVPLGAPGVYVVPERPAPPPLGVPMDECAFVGVAPRGPAWVEAEGDDGPTRAQATAVAVRSWDEYRLHFGGFEGPGLLPLAVSSFFEQGGRVAHVVRVVSRVRAADGAPAGRAALTFGPSVRTANGGAAGLLARDEGAWGRNLRATLSFTATVLPTEAGAAADRRLPLGSAPLAGGTLLRITAGGAALLRVVESCEREPVPGDADGERRWVAWLDLPVTDPITRVELVEATVDVADLDPTLERHERFDHVGLLPVHPRWLGAVVAEQSRLVELAPGSEDGVLPVAATLDAASTTVDDGTGEDRYALVDEADVLDAGVAAAVAVPAVALLAVPDLYAPGSLAPLEDVVPPTTLAGADFAECVPLRSHRPPSVAPPPELKGLLLDPGVPSELAQIVVRQQAVVRLAEQARVVALLDVPPGLRPVAVHRWRRRFVSSYAAAYHPWVLVPRDGAGGRDRLVSVPPSAVAAGVIARVERAAGLARGPANEVAYGVPALAARVAADEHAELHWEGVNVFALEPDGVFLTGARTLSTDRSWRQLTARRVVTMVERSVAQQLQWVVFEPNTATTRTAVRTRVDTLLRDLFRAGAFRGAHPDQSYFVRTAEGASLSVENDEGRLVCEIGVAPSEPMEFLLVRVIREGDGTIRTESRRG